MRACRLHCSSTLPKCSIEVAALNMRPPSSFSFGSQQSDEAPIDDGGSLLAPLPAFLPDTHRGDLRLLYPSVAATTNASDWCIAFALVRQLRLQVRRLLPAVALERHPFDGSTCALLFRARPLLGRAVKTLSCDNCNRRCTSKCVPDRCLMFRSIELAR